MSQNNEMFRQFISQIYIRFFPHIYFRGLLQSEDKKKAKCRYVNHYTLKQPLGVLISTGQKVKTFVFVY